MKKMKEILSEMQINVGTHNFKINKDLVDEQKLKIAMELLESQLDYRVSTALSSVEQRILPKVKKRLKMKQLKQLFLEKMGRADAMAQIERLDVKIDQMDNKFEYGMPPAMLQRLENFNKQKADKEEVGEILKSKVDQTAFESLIDRLNRVEELIASNKKLKSPRGGKKTDSPDDPGSPDSIKKGEGAEEEEEEDEDDDEEGGKKIKELMKKVDDNEKKF